MSPELFGFPGLTLYAVMVVRDWPLQRPGVDSFVVLETQVSVHYTVLVLVLMNTLPANRTLLILQKQLGAWYTVSLHCSLGVFETFVQNNKGCTNVYMYDIKNFV